ncbi:hypothetical protein ABPG72_018208 [Tetrahymena utriculariae]
MECQLEKKSLNSNTASLDHRQEPLIKRNKGPRIGDLLKKRKLRLLRKEEKTKIKAEELVLKSIVDQHIEQISNEDEEEEEFDRGLHTKEECHLHEQKIKKIQSLKEKANKYFSFEMYQQQYDLKYACKNKSYQSYCQKNIKTQNLNDQNEEDSQQLFKRIKLFDSYIKKKIEKSDSKQKSIYEMCHSLVQEYLIEGGDEEDSKFQASNNSEESDHSNMDQEVYQQIIEDQYQQFEDATKRKKKIKRVLTYQEKHNELLKAASKYQQIKFPNSKKAFKKGSFQFVSKQVFLQQQQQSDNTTIPIQNSQINIGNNFTVHSNIQTLNPQLQQFQYQNHQQQNQQNNNAQYQPHYQQQDIIMHDQGPEYLLKKVRLLEGCNKYLDKISWEAPEEELDKMEKEFRQSQVKPDQTITQLNNSNKRTIIQDKKFEKVYHSLRRSIKWSEKIFDENSQVFNKMLVELNIEQNLSKDDFNILNSYKIQLVTPINESNLIDKKKNEQILEFFMQENNFVMDKSQIRDISGCKGNQHQQQQAQINQFKTYHQQVLQQQNQAQHIQSQMKPVELRGTLGQTQQQQQQIVLGGQQNLLNYQQQFNQNQRINQDQQIEQAQCIPYNSDTANQFKFGNQFKGVVSSQQLHQSQGHNIPSDQQHSQQQSGQNMTKKIKGGNIQSQSINFHHYIKCFKNNQLSAGGISSSNNLNYQNQKYTGGKNEYIVIDSPKRAQQNNQQTINLQQESNQTCNGQTINTGQNQYDSSFFQNMQNNCMNQQQTQQQTQQIVINSQHKSQQGYNNTKLLEQGSNQNFKVNQLPQSQFTPTSTNQNQQNIQQQNVLPPNQLLQHKQQISQIQNQFPQLNQYPLINQFNKVNYVQYNPYAITTQFLQAPISAVNNSYNQFFTSSLSNNNNNNPNNQQISSNTQPAQLQNQQQQQSQTWPFGQISIQNTVPQQQLSSQNLQNNNQQQQAQQQTGQLQQQVNRQLQLLTSFKNQPNSQVYFQMSQNPQQQNQIQQQFNQNRQQNDSSLQKFPEQNQLINQKQNQQQQQAIKQSSPTQANEELNIDQYTQLLQSQQQNNQKYQQQYFNNIQSNMNSNLVVNNNINSNTTSTANNMPNQNRSATNQLIQNQGQQNNYFLLLNQSYANNQINQVSQQQQQQQQHQPQSVHQNQLYLLMQQQQQQSYPMLPIITASQNALDTSKMHQVVIQQGVVNSAATATACIPNQNLLNNKFLLNNQITQSQII